MTNLSDEYIDKLIKKVHLIEIVVFLIGFISFCAFYSWSYSLGGIVALFIALIPGFLWAWCQEMLEDIRKYLISLKTTN